MISFAKSCVYRITDSIKNRLALNEHLKKAIDAYEDYIGVREIKEIQLNVLQVNELLNTQGR